MRITKRMSVFTLIYQDHLKTSQHSGDTPLILFDYHVLCKGGKKDNLETLKKKAQPYLHKFKVFVRKGDEIIRYCLRRIAASRSIFHVGFSQMFIHLRFFRSLNGRIIFETYFRSLQSGTVRVNCLDCLDRTNAVQSFLGLEVGPFPFTILIIFKC